MKLNPFSYCVLTLVGDGGATAPELAAMMERGRMYWTAPRSQWYAEPKKLADAGYLAGEEEPGRTGPRTRYRITDAGRAALADWVRTPAPLPRMQQEAVVRVMAADLVDDPLAVVEGLQGLRAELAETRARLGEGQEAAQDLPARDARLQAQHRMALRLCDVLEDWADEAEGLLREEAAQRAS